MGGLAGTLWLVYFFKVRKIEDDIKINPGLPHIHKLGETVELILPFTVINLTDYNLSVHKFSLRLYLKNAQGEWTQIGISPRVLQDLKMPSNETTKAETTLAIDTTAFFQLNADTELQIESVFTLWGFKVRIPTLLKVSDIIPVDLIKSISKGIFQGLGCACAPENKQLSAPAYLNGLL